MSAIQMRIKESWPIITEFEKLEICRSKVKLKRYEGAEV
jgi:hypothetical protein